MKKKDRVVTESILEDKLEEKFKVFKIEIKEEMRDEMVMMRDYLDEKSRSYRDEILARFDSFAGRVQA